MAIFRCKKCNHLREVSNDCIGRSVRCPMCKEVGQIYDTVEFVTKLLGKYLQLYKEFRQLQLQQEIPAIASDVTTPQAVAESIEFDIHNTTEMTKSAQYEPIVTWFEQKQIQVNVDHKAVDTTGFFDEVAVQIGDQYDLLKDMLDKIKRAQKNGYTNATVNLANESQKTRTKIIQFCKELHEYSFIARYYHDKKASKLHLTLQTAPAIVNFFNGEWLEWFVFMKLLAFFREKKMTCSGLRSFTINFSNEDVHEIDVFFLINGSLPVFIECKTGEVNSFIEKYSKLRKRLHLEKSNFLLLGMGLNDQQTQGFNSMYDITFVNERNFVSYVSGLFA